MEKKKVLTKILAILLVILIGIISFVGIYVKDRYKYENKIPDYQLGMDIEGSRIVTLKVDDSTETKTYDKDGNLVESSDDDTDTEEESNSTENAETADESEGNTTVEEPVNNEEVLTADNYDICKKIIEKRLNSLKVQEYTVRLDKDNGKIAIQIPENDTTDTVVSNLQTVGKFEIKDVDTNEVLMDNNDLKETTVGIAQTSSGTGSAYYVVSMQIKFNKQGQAKFKDITNNYKKTTDEEGNSTEKQIELKIDDETIITTSFDEEISNGIMQLTMGNSSTTNVQLLEYLEQASSIATTINEGKMPVVYTLDNQIYEASDITKEDKQLALTIILAIFAVLLIAMIIRFKKSGILAIFTNIGFIASLLLIIRFSNVVLTIEGISTIIFTTILNYIFVWILLKEYTVKKEEKNVFNTVMFKSLVTIIPIAIVSIVLTFSNWLPLASCGMVGIWAVMLWLIYSFIITKTLAEK